MCKKLIEEGSADGFVSEHIFLEQITKENPNIKIFKVEDDTFQKSPYSIFIKKNGQKLQEEIENALYQVLEIVPDKSSPNFSQTRDNVYKNKFLQLGIKIHDAQLQVNKKFIVNRLFSKIPQYVRPALLLLL